MGGLIREKLNDHITEETMAGELEYFEDARSFERPYGYAWLLALYAELSDWDDSVGNGDSVAGIQCPVSSMMVTVTGHWELDTGYRILSTDPTDAPACTPPRPS